MIDAKLAEYLDTRRWLINNGLLDENTKAQIWEFAAYVSPDVIALEVDIDVENKSISYTLYGEDQLIKNFNKFHKLVKAKTFIGVWLLKRFLRKHGSQDIEGMLQRCISDFLGPKWKVKAQLKHINLYVEDAGVEGGSREEVKQTDQLLNEEQRS